MEVGWIINGEVLRPAQEVGIESGRHTVWEKETKDRIKVKDGAGGLKISWVKSPVLWSHLTFI